MQPGAMPPGFPDQKECDQVQAIVDWVNKRPIYLGKPTGRYAPFFTAHIDAFRATLVPGDVLLIEGNSRLSAMI